MLQYIQNLKMERAILMSNPYKQRRVVITGMGAVSPLGGSLLESWNHLLQGEHGISELDQNMQHAGLRVHVAAKVHDFDPLSYLTSKQLRRMERFSQFACVAAGEALQDAAISSHTVNLENFGVSLGVGMGGVSSMCGAGVTLQERGASKISPFLIPQIIPNMAAGMIASIYGLKGPNICTTTACTSGTHAVGEGYLLIQNSLADAMLVGGAESAITGVALAAFGNMRALSTEKNPRRASCPFDQTRNGFVMGEGAGVLILEELEHAKQRNASIYAEVLGYGMSGDAYHMTAPAPEGEGAQRSMRKALQLANISPDKVDYINAHGTSTLLNDLYESKAIRAVFAQHADTLAVSSTKGATGHLLGGAGGLEACFSVLALKHQIAPPTVHLDHPDPECDLDYVPHKARRMNMQVAISNSFGFGGTNATLVLATYAP